VIATYPLDLAPAEPFLRTIRSVAPDAAVTVQVRDAAGAALLEYTAGNPDRTVSFAK
jgi:hypothetical protein